MDSSRCAKGRGDVEAVNETPAQIALSRGKWAAIRGESVATLRHLCGRRYGVMSPRISVAKHLLRPSPPLGGAFGRGACPFKSFSQVALPLPRLVAFPLPVGANPVALPLP